MRLMSTMYSRRNESQFHHRYEALAAGKQLGFGTEFLKQSNCLVQRVGREVLKAPRYHRASPSYIGFDFSCVNLSVSTGKGMIIRGSET